MVDFTSILDADCVAVDVEATSKKRALELGSELIAKHHLGISDRALFDQLTARERLGSTGLGEGVAIPHCRSREASGILGALLRLQEPVDFEAPDGEGVDLIFLLVVPSDADDTHLEVLAQLARVFGDAANRRRLREAPTSRALYDTFAEIQAGPNASATGA